MKPIALLLLTTSLFCAEGVNPRPHQQRELKELTHEQFMQKAEERFASIDTDGNGVLSVEEREAARQSHMQQMRERMQERHSNRQENRQERREQRRENREE